MTLTREEAWKHLCEWTETDSLRKHARAVEIVMRRAAHQYGGGLDDEERWSLAGLLHAAGFELLGVEPYAHIQFIIDALKPHAEELGIGGRGGAP